MATVIWLTFALGCNVAPPSPVAPTGSSESSETAASAEECSGPGELVPTVPWWSRPGRTSLPRAVDRDGDGVQELAMLWMSGAAGLLVSADGTAAEVGSEEVVGAMVSSPIATNGRPQIVVVDDLYGPAYEFDSCDSPPAWTVPFASVLDGVDLTETSRLHRVTTDYLCAGAISPYAVDAAVDDRGAAVLVSNGLGGSVIRAVPPGDVDVADVATLDAFFRDGRLVDLDADGLAEAAIRDDDGLFVHPADAGSVTPSDGEPWAAEGPVLRGDGDVDGDGSPELLLVLGDTATLVTHPMAAVVATLDAPTLGADVLDDLDGDGTAELVTQPEDGETLVWLGPLSGALDPSAAALVIPGDFHEVVSVDLDGDGADLLVSDGLDWFRFDVCDGP